MLSDNMIFFISYFLMVVKMIGEQHQRGTEWKTGRWISSLTIRQFNQNMKTSFESIFKSKSISREFDSILKEKRESVYDWYLIRCWCSRFDLIDHIDVLYLSRQQHELQKRRRVIKEEIERIVGGRERFLFTTVIREKIWASSIDFYRSSLYTHCYHM